MKSFYARLKICMTWEEWLRLPQIWKLGNSYAKQLRQAKYRCIIKSHSSPLLWHTQVWVRYGFDGGKSVFKCCCWESNEALARARGGQTWAQLGCADTRWKCLLWFSTWGVYKLWRWVCGWKRYRAKSFIQGTFCAFPFKSFESICGVGGGGLS